MFIGKNNINIFDVYSDNMMRTFITSPYACSVCIKRKNLSSARISRRGIKFSAFDSTYKIKIKISERIKFNFNLPLRMLGRAFERWIKMAEFRGRYALRSLIRLPQ